MKIIIIKIEYFSRFGKKLAGCVTKMYKNIHTKNVHPVIRCNDILKVINSNNGSFCAQKAVIFDAAGVSGTFTATLS